MKQQKFFVGDKVVRTQYRGSYEPINRSIAIVTAVELDEEDGNFYLCFKESVSEKWDADYFTIVERAWQENDGIQMVDEDTFIEILLEGSSKPFVAAVTKDWWECDIGRVKWRIAENYEEQPEAVPPSHVALGDNLVQVGEPYMKIWCDTCQGPGEVDETVGGESFSGRDTPCPDCAGNGWWERVIAASVEAVPVQQDKKHSHYFKKCGYDYVDVYRVLKMFDVTDPCISHACKKLLVSGGRGFKDIDHDIQDVIDTLVRWQEMRKEDGDA